MRTFGKVFLLVNWLIMSWAASADQQEFTIGVEEINYYPYYHLVKKDYQGFARDLFDAFAKKEGIAFKYRPLPITRLYRELKEGKVDFKFPDNKFWAKDEKARYQFAYSNAVVGFIDGVMVPPESKMMARAELKSIGFVRGFSPWTLMDSINDGSIKANKVNSWKSLIKLTLSKRVDGAYFNLAVGENLLKNEMKKPGALVFAENLPHDKSNYSVSTIKHQAMLDKLNVYLQSEEAQAIRSKYGLEVYSIGE